MSFFFNQTVVFSQILREFAANSAKISICVAFGGFLEVCVIWAVAPSPVLHRGFASLSLFRPPHHPNKQKSVIININTFFEFSQTFRERQI
jgi:hypothetical protein